MSTPPPAPIGAVSIPRSGFSSVKLRALPPVVQDHAGFNPAFGIQFGEAESPTASGRVSRCFNPAFGIQFGEARRGAGYEIVTVGFNPAFGIQFGEATYPRQSMKVSQSVSIPRSGFSSVKRRRQDRRVSGRLVSIPRSGFSSVKRRRRLLLPPRR